VTGHRLGFKLACLCQFGNGSDSVGVVQMGRPDQSRKSLSNEAGSGMNIDIEIVIKIEISIKIVIKELNYIKENS
jgi:hypothetical protein